MIAVNDLYTSLVGRFLDGEPAAFVVAVDPVGEAPAGSGGCEVGWSPFGEAVQCCVVGHAPDVVARRLADELVEAGTQRVAVCDTNLWGLVPRSALGRVFNVDDPVVHPAHGSGVATLRPITEVLAVGSGQDRRACEARAIGLLEAGAVEAAGFVSFEIDESPEQRVRWLRGLIEVCAEALPQVPAVVEAVELVRWPIPTGVHEQFSAVRRVTLEAPGMVTRVTAVAELVLKVTHNMSVEETDRWDFFDRDSGWWMARVAAGVVEGGGSPEFMDAMFPVTRGRWDRYE